MDNCRKSLRPGEKGHVCGAPAARWFQAPSMVRDGTAYLVVRCEEHAGLVVNSAVEISRSEAEVLTVMRS